MSPEEQERLVQTFLRYQRTGRESRSWADDRMRDLVRLQPEEAWPVIRAIVTAADVERTLATSALASLKISCATTAVNSSTGSSLRPEAMPSFA